jgi:hypothetical protein
MRGTNAYEGSDRRTAAAAAVSPPATPMREQAIGGSGVLLAFDRVEQRSRAEPLRP